MKIFILTAKLSPLNGSGRYSIEVIQALKKSGTEVVVSNSELLPNPLNYRRNYFLAFWYAWKLRKFAKNCDLIHCFIEPYSHIAYWLSKFTGKKYIVTTHGTYGVLPYYQSLWRRFFHKKSFRNAFKIICVSNYTKKVLSEIGLENLHVIKNGIDFDKFYRPPVSGFDERKNVVLSVGALKYRKGQHISLEAFAEAARGHEDAKYYLVGNQSDSEYLVRLKKITVNLKIENKVEFLSSIPDEELLDLYKQAKVFVLTSLSENHHFEGFGLVYLEANACGTPVVGSLESGAEDAIVDGKTGFFGPQNNIESVAESMKKLLEDKNLWESMSPQCVDWARKHDWGEIIKEYAKIYQLGLNIDDGEI